MRLRLGWPPWSRARAGYLAANASAVVAQPSNGKNKPVDLWLMFAGWVLAIVVSMMQHTSWTLGIAGAIMFALLFHPVWNFWWVEDRPQRRAGALLLLACAIGAFCFASLPQQLGPRLQVPLAYAPAIDPEPNISATAAPAIQGTPMTLLSFQHGGLLSLAPIGECWKLYSSVHGYPSYPDRDALSYAETVGVDGCEPLPTPSPYPSSSPFGNPSSLLTTGVIGAVPQLSREVPTTYYKSVQAGTASIYISVTYSGDNSSPGCAIWSGGRFYQCPKVQP